MMFGRQRHILLVNDALQVLLVGLLVAGLVLLATGVAGETVLRTNRSPEILPDAIDTWASPLSPPTVPQALFPLVPSETDQAISLWKTLKMHRDGNTKSALEAWKRTPLPCESDVWRHVAIVAARLQMLDIDRANHVLDFIQRVEPDNPVVHYYRGLALLLESATGPQRFDAIEQRDTRFASSETGLPARGKTHYYLAAIDEFELAIKMADKLDGNKSLLSSTVLDPVDGTRANSTRVKKAILIVTPDVRPENASLAVPTVNDLLVAIGADNFQGKSHSLAGMLGIELDLLPAAEEHLDSAVKLGVKAFDSYGVLAKRYEDFGKHDDAFRANLKAMAHGEGVVKSGSRALDNLFKLFTK
jgi:hypothetical protein